MSNPNQIKLRLINRSNDINLSSFVIFQKNLADSFEELPVAWKVVQNLGLGNYHPFTFTRQLQVSASDSWGNYTYPQNAENGLRYQMKQNPSGDQLLQDGNSTCIDNFEVENALPKGIINAHCYRDGKLVGTKTSLSPGEKVEFQFRHTIFIGAASQVEEGKIMDSAIISDINTEISLSGILSADIVITGGGAGPNATAFQFSLENVQYV